MRIEERYVVPGLGVIILLSLVALNVSLIYLVVLGILGIAAIGTYFLPHAVQIETRIVISALGLFTCSFTSAHWASGLLCWRSERLGRFSLDTARQSGLFPNTRLHG